jgi:hypothetical protein
MSKEGGRSIMKRIRRGTKKGGRKAGSTEDEEKKTYLRSQKEL